MPCNCLSYCVAELIAETRRSLRTDYKVLEEQAGRRISLAERLHFCSFLSSVKPFLAHHPAQLIQERHQLVNKMAAVVKDVKVAAVCNRVGEMLLISRG